MPEREMLEFGLNNMLFPDPTDKTGYSRHVRMRTEMFCYLLHSVGNLCLKYQPPRPYESYLSDTAEAQVGTGLRFAETTSNPKLSIDAAHYCNTSFRVQDLMVHVGTLGKSARDYAAISAYCDGVQMASAATSFQLQKDNVGPDKIIDSYQTYFKNQFLKAVKTHQRMESGRDTYTRFVTELHSHLSNSTARSMTNTSASGYEGAAAAKKLLAAIDLKYLSWSIEEEFVHIQRAVANLP